MSFFCKKTHSSDKLSPYSWLISIGVTVVISASVIAHRSIHISYPNDEDKARAKSLEVNPGGDIMIHGQMNGFGHLGWLNQRRDWTDGCIAVTNTEMDEIMVSEILGTLIEIVE